jgi:curli biogenesis system outer membrane secretion channel CsgG
MMKSIGALGILSALVLLCPLAPAPALADAAVAVGGIADDGVDPMFAANFDPGKAFGDILTDKLVNIGKLSMVDRAHIDAVTAEQKNVQSGGFAAADAVQLGHMVGANYLIVGRIAHLDKGSSSTAAVGNLLGNFGVPNVSTSQDRYRLDIELQFIDSSTGRIVKAFTYDQTRVAHGVVIGPTTGSATGAATDPTTGGGAYYATQQFASSIVGQLLNSAGDDLAKKISAIDLTALPAVTTVTMNALLIAADGTNVILNKGSADRVTVGMFLNTYHAVTANDPATGRALVTNIPDGQIEVISVGPNSSAARVVSGKPTAPGGFASTQ